MEQAGIFERLKHKDISQRQAAAILGHSRQWVRKKLKRYRDHGAEGLIHKNSGRASPHRTPEEHEKIALELLHDKLHGAGPTYLAEKLFELHDIKISNESMRKIMIRHQAWTVVHNKPKHRQRRERRTQVGIMVQLDGSPHDWFEGRGPRCTLLVFIDDATSRILWLQFVTGEAVEEVMRATMQYMRTFGRPISLYVDYGSVWSVNTNNPDRDKLTQFERAMKELGIEVIHARSPQAKGRVERANKTLQDRLIKDMRLANICSMEAANKFAQDVYIPAHNKRFAVDPAESIDAHRSLDGFDLNHIMCIREERVVSQDYVISYHKQLLQLTAHQSTIVRPKERVMINRHLDGQISVFIRKTKLNFKTITTRPMKVTPEKIVRQVHHRPPSNHPWRKWTNIKPAPTIARTHAEAAGLSPLGDRRGDTSHIF